jgi:hypothetical protein
MAADSQIDLFPWILGCLLIGAAVPAVIAVTERGIRSPPAAAVAPSPVSIAVPAAQPAIPPAPVPVPQTAAAPAVVTPALEPPTAQIWQCVVNGQRIFSDKRCGADATVRQLGELNRMDAVPVGRAPPYPPYPYYPPASAYYPGAADQDASDTDSGSTATQVILVNGRDRREHRPGSHHPALQRGGPHN